MSKKINSLAQLKLLGKLAIALLVGAVSAQAESPVMSRDVFLSLRDGLFEPRIYDFLEEKFDVPGHWLGFDELVDLKRSDVASVALDRFLILLQAAGIAEKDVSTAIMTSAFTPNPTDLALILEGFDPPTHRVLLTEYRDRVDFLLAIYSKQDVDEVALEAFLAETADEDDQKEIKRIETFMPGYEEVYYHRGLFSGTSAHYQRRQCIQRFGGLHTFNTLSTFMSGEPKTVEPQDIAFRMLLRFSSSQRVRSRYGIEKEQAQAMNVTQFRSALASSQANRTMEYRKRFDEQVVDSSSPNFIGANYCALSYLNVDINRLDAQKIHARFVESNRARYEQ